MAGPDSAIDHLIALMAKLPGLGPRSARRAVLYMIRKRGLLLFPLADGLSEGARSARSCVNCGNVATGDLCPICRDDRRQNGTLCVVEEVGDLWAMERAGAFRGTYHVLGGTLSALDGIRPEDLNIASLIGRVTRAREEGSELEEVILAMNATVDGQTTAHYITEHLEETGVKVTRLAHGVPIGGELDYLGDGTIAAAMKSRRML